MISGKGSWEWEGLDDAGAFRWLAEEAEVA